MSIARQEKMLLHVNMPAEHMELIDAVARSVDPDCWDDPGLAMNARRVAARQFALEALQATGIPLDDLARMRAGMPARQDDVRECVRVLRLVQGGIRSIPIVDKRMGHAQEEITKALLTTVELCIREIHKHFAMEGQS